ncbi:MAG: MOSC domain-containing protein [Anaerolineae bacterium]
MTSTLIAVCLGEDRWQPKHDVREGVLCAGHGLLGDAHAGLSEREVSLLSTESLYSLEAERGISAQPGSFAENLVVDGLAVESLTVGDLLIVGAAILEIVQIGKPPGTPHTYSYQGVSLLPTAGVFCHVLQGGRIAAGDAVSHQPAQRADQTQGKETPPHADRCRQR